MQRPIDRFEKDEDNDWFATLSCGHTVHQRHNPPWHNRSWVLDEATRTAQLGSSIACIYCERLEMPEDAKPYQETKTFSESTVPKGLLNAHTTKAGVWGLIQVASGELAYHIHAPLKRSLVLKPGTPGVVAPEVEHEVAPLGPVSFKVIFHRIPKTKD